MRDVTFDGIQFNDEWLQGVEIDFHHYMNGMMLAVSEQEAWIGMSGRRFCGCPGCISREILAYLVPRLVRGINSGMIATVQKEQ